MKARNKILLLALCMAALIAVSVLGTMAYLTSTDEVVNTFTVGNVKITLDEARVNTDGDKLYVPADDKETENYNGYVTEAEGNTIAKRVKANTYKLMPGHSYTKDPTVTVKAGSEEAYIRMIVTAEFDKKLTDEKLAMKLDNIFTGFDEASWKQVKKDVTTTGEGENAKTKITYEYRYIKDNNPNTTFTAEKDKDTALSPLFNNVVIPGEWTNDDLAAIGGVKITIVAEAIQADGFADAAAAWAAFDTQK